MQAITRVHSINTRRTNAQFHTRTLQLQISPTRSIQLSLRVWGARRGPRTRTRLLDGIRAAAARAHPILVRPCSYAPWSRSCARHFSGPRLGLSLGRLLQRRSSTTMESFGVKAGCQGALGHSLRRRSHRRDLRLLLYRCYHLRLQPNFRLTQRWLGLLPLPFGHRLLRRLL